MRAAIAKGLSRVPDVLTTSSRLLRIIWTIDARLFVLAVLVIIIPSVVPFVNAYIYKLVIDAVIAGVSTRTVDMDALGWLLALRVVTYFLQDAAFGTQNYVEQRLWTKVPIHLQTMILGKISSLDIEKFEDAAFRDNLERVRESMHRPQNMITTLLFGLQSLLQLTIATAAIFTLHWMLIIIVTLVAVPEFLYRLYESQAGWTIWAWQSPRKRRFSYLSWLLQDARSVKELRTFRLAPLFVSETKDLQEQFYQENTRLATRSFLFRLVFNLLSTFLFIGVEVFVILRAIAGRVTIGDISFYTQVVSNFQNGLGGLLSNLSSLFENTLYVKSIFEILDTPSKIAAPAHPALLTTKGPPKIVFDRVAFQYPGAQTPNLADFSLTIEPKEKIALVGENGAGKSTVIKLLARFYDPTAGRILIDGRDLRELDLGDWHRHLGILFQDFNRYEDTFLRNIYYGNVLGAIDDQAISQAASDSGASAVVESLEKGYEHMLGTMFQQGAELSAGQWQKVALARAYFRAAPVLVLDEPTAAIDAKAESEIFARVEELCRDKTVILISHRFSTVRMADRIVVLKDGRILEEGSHEALMARRGLYSELFTLQAKGYA